MKILLNNPMLAHGAFHHWMTADLVALGHNVSFLDPDDLCEQFGIGLYRRILLQRIAAERPEMVLVYPPYDLLRPRDAERIREMGTCIVGFAYDDPLYLPAWTRLPGQFERVLEEFRRTYDVYVTTSRQMAREAAARGHDWVRPIRWAINTPTTPVNGNRDVPLLLVGAPYPRRVNMVRHLRNAGIKPLIFGAETWKQYPELADQYKGMLTRPAMFDMYRRAQIALAPADWESSYSPMVKLRTLEIAGCGAFQLVENAEDLHDYYNEGSEIVAYKTWDELVELINRYSNDAAGRHRIGRAGFDRTIKDHVWKVRWDELEQQVRPVVDRLRTGGLKPSIKDDHLNFETTMVTCALHYERHNDNDTAMVAYSEWETVCKDSFELFLGKARVLLCQRRFVEAERYFRLALEHAKDLCPRGIDITVTQRKLGPRMGLGRLFSGIFPRKLEVCSHLFICYANMDREADIDALLKDLSDNQDEMFVSLVAILAEPNPDKLVTHKYILKFLDVLLSAKPFVWDGEQKRHRAHFIMLRGQALAGLGRLPEAVQMLQSVLTMSPAQHIETQVRRDLATLLGLPSQPSAMGLSAGGAQMVVNR